MLDVKDLLNNDSVKQILDKAGISNDKAESLLKQATQAVNTHFKANPGQMSSLLSSNPNTDDDNKMAQKVENDFLGDIAKKVGLSASVTSNLQGLMPAVLNQISSKATSAGKNDSNGLADLLNGFTGGSAKSGGVMSTVTSLLSGFFKK